MKSSFLMILVIALIIAGLGIISIYSGTYQKEGSLWQLTYQRQILWVIIGLVCFLIISFVNYRPLWDWTYVLFGVAMVCLLLVFILGIVRLGAQRWLRLLWFNFQPSELVKLSVVVFLARYFSRKSIDDIGLISSRLGMFRGVLLPLFFVGIPMSMIIEQPDLGSGLMVLFTFIAMVYLAKIKIRYCIVLLVILLVPIPFLWQMLRDYQKERLMVFLNPNIDPLGAGYTIIQSKIAIGSGGLWGKGWLGGTQSQLHFLPEAHTDFIFATFGEEWGFIGGMFLFVLYFLLVRQGIVIARRTRDQFGRLLALGISVMLGLQIFVNIAMTMGLAPVVGVPLPLMSYGGSSVVVTFISLGILSSIDRRKTMF
ncbi:MAG: rod shape-determining protein RodA [Candidatus Omnitrophica bacterium]|nr:rod shape-determining protein RodA [Candidatus Omnitrophota bacterium]